MLPENILPARQTFLAHFTDSQASLGHRGPTPTNRLEASRLIDELVKGGKHATR